MELAFLSLLTSLGLLPVASDCVASSPPLASSTSGGPTRKNNYPSIDRAGSHLITRKWISAATSASHAAIGSKATRDWLNQGHVTFHSPPLWQPAPSLMYTLESSLIHLPKFIAINFLFHLFEIHLLVQLIILQPSSGRNSLQIHRDWDAMKVNALDLNDSAPVPAGSGTWPTTSPLNEP